MERRRRVQVEVLESEEVEHSVNVVHHIPTKCFVEWEGLQAGKCISGKSECLAGELSAWVCLRGCGWYSECRSGKSENSSNGCQRPHFGDESEKAE